MTQGALAQHIRPLLQSCNTAPLRPPELRIRFRCLASCWPPRFLARCHLKNLSEIARCFQQTSPESRSPTKFIDIVQLPGTPRFSRSVLEIATVNCWQIL